MSLFKTLADLSNGKILFDYTDSIFRYQNLWFPVADADLLSSRLRLAVALSDLRLVPPETIGAFIRYDLVVESVLKMACDYLARHEITLIRSGVRTRQAERADKAAQVTSDLKLVRAALAYGNVRILFPSYVSGKQEWTVEVDAVIRTATTVDELDSILIDVLAAIRAEMRKELAGEGDVE